MNSEASTATQQIPGYSLEEKLYSGSRTQVFRASRKQDHKRVIIKMPAGEQPERTVLGRLKHEYEVNRKVAAADGVVQALELCRYDRGVALVFENTDGVSLKTRLRESGGRIQLTDFFPLAISLAEGVEQIHQAGVIHKDIKPSNIIVSPGSSRAQINDFGLATLLTRESAENFNVDTLQGTLAYISPEQTGRMNRDVDYRSDFYSLGVTFYEILTGGLPFRVTDPMAMVHCHIARDPQPPHMIHAAIPEALSAVLMKLMAKTPEDRYQGARGLLFDLKELQRRHDAREDGGDFVVGRQDVSERFQIPQKLYGREREIEELLHSFEAAARGKSRLLLVTGYSGIGKSSVINEVHKPVVESEGFFITGKFDQYKRDMPYAAFISAFQSLVRQVLAETPETVRTFRTQLNTALGQEGQVIVDLLPELELLIGPQAPVPTLDTVESLNRLSQCFRRFTAVFAAAEHPLVLFIDDLQWADIPSLNLMEILLTTDEVSHMLILGAYRDNEVGPGHPLLPVLDQIDSAGSHAGKVLLAPLSEDHLREMISESLRQSPAEVAELARLIKKKTAGNPFFARQLLTSLYTENHLRLDPDTRSWTWNLDQIDALDNTENVLDLMAGKLHRLQPATRERVLLAACVGGSFDLGTLATVGETAASVVSADLAEALQEGLILPIGEDYKYIGDQDAENEKEPRTEIFATATYRFAHDRVHQAAYGLLDQHEKQTIHQRIGELLLSRLPAKSLDERLFEVVEHLNRAKDLLESREERIQLVEHNLHAGEKAMKSAAFSSALTYLRQATELLDEEAWDDHQELAWRVYREMADCEYSTALLEESEQHILFALPRTRTEDQKVKLYQVYLKVLFQMNRHQDGVNLAREALKFLGISLPKKIGKHHVGLQYLRFRLALGRRPVSDLLHLPKNENARTLNICKIIYDSVPSTYIVSPDTMGMIGVLMARICLQHGNSSYSSFAFSMITPVQTGVTKEFKRAAEFSQIAIALAEKYPDQDPLGRAHFLTATFACHWSRPVGAYQKHVQTARQCFHESGNLHWRNYATTFTRTQSLLYQDKPLSEIAEENLQFYAEHLRTRDREVSLNQYYLIRFIRGLQDKPMDDVSNEYEFDPASYEQEMFQPGNFMQRTYYFTFQMIDAFTREDFSAAFGFSRESSKIVLEILGVLLDHPTRYYTALTRLALHGKLSWKERLTTSLPDLLNKFLLGHAARNAPENFLSQHLLVQAEVARCKGKTTAALDLYNRAVDAARNQGFPQQLALANELTGKFFLSIDQTRSARMYLSEARYHYELWGARAKVRQLDETYGPRVGDLRPATKVEAHTRADESEPSTTTSAGSSLDMDTVLKAARAVSGEIKREKLLERMMQLLVENAGAGRGLLVLEREGQLFVEAEEDASTGEVHLMKSVPIETAGNLCLPVVRLVQNSQRSVVLGDARREGDFRNDPYLQGNQVKSLLCAPIVSQGRSKGVVYLENNLAENAFTAGQLKTVDVIASQAAIALDNANLYAGLESLNRDLEQKVIERTEELRVSRDAAEQAFAESERLLLNILPAPVARELKERGEIDPVMFSSVSIMFTDFVGFTKVAARIMPHELVDELNGLFLQFDEICERHNIEKLKTIGDAYMAAGGIPNINNTHAIDLCMASLEIQAFMLKIAEIKQFQNEDAWQLRLGIHTGPVIAGVIGKNKFAYDVWGDAVNVASRMETAGVPGRINISDATHALIAPFFETESRGPIHVKNRGELEMYFLNRLKPELSADEEGRRPNAAFWKLFAEIPEP